MLLVLMSSVTALARPHNSLLPKIYHMNEVWNTNDAQHSAHDYQAHAARSTEGHILEHFGA